MRGGEQRSRGGRKQSLMSGVDVIGNGGAFVRVENCFVLFFLSFLSIRVHKFCLFSFVWFCFHPHEVGVQFVMLLKGKCRRLVFVVTASVMVGDARRVFRGLAPTTLSFSFFLFLEARAIQSLFFCLNGTSHEPTFAIGTFKK